MNDDYKIELFVFPDGTAVEMMVFDPAAKSATPRRAAQASAHTETAASHRCEPCRHDTHCEAPAEHRTPAPLGVGSDAQTCPVCGSTLVYPVDWQRSGEATWSLELRCPNCQMRRDVVLGREAVESLNRELYHGAQALAREAEQLTRRNFEEEVEKIVSALDGDLILPMDF